MKITLTVVLLALACPGLAIAQTITFTPTAGVPTFAVREPILRLKPGTIVETKTFSQPGDYYEGGAWPGEVGPFHIEGAAPGDTLVVRIIRLRPNRDTAVSRYNPGGISGVAGDGRTRMLNDPLPARAFTWRLDRERMVGILDLPNSASKRIEVPLKPMLGRVAVAPAGQEAFGGLWPGDFGGNLDASDVREGATVYLPVFHPRRALLLRRRSRASGRRRNHRLGPRDDDGRDVSVRCDQGQADPLAAHRGRPSTSWSLGSVRPLIDALRIAYVELIEWLVAEYGFEKMEAFQVASQVGEVRVANVVDPNYTVVAKFPKRLLPPKR